MAKLRSQQLEKVVELLADELLACAGFRLFGVSGRTRLGILRTLGDLRRLRCIYNAHSKTPS
jgi:hypothetical protein